MNKKKDINMKEQNINAEQYINKKQDINKEQYLNKDKKLEKMIEKFNDEECNNEGEEYNSDDEIIETKREIEFLCSQPQTPETRNTINLYR